MLSNTPTQPAAIVYGSTAGLSAYAHPGGMVVAGRDNYKDPAFAAVANGGGNVLIYLDAVINNAAGTYHSMLINSSACGPAVPKWPGQPAANAWGSLNDFRVGGVLQGKLECVAEQMVRDNPGMGGIFADDLGSRSWFAGINWESWTRADQQAYRDGAIAMLTTLRKVADRHGLIVLVNGTWAAGDLSTSGGGYPDMAQSGNALADGGVIEHHDSETAYFTKYACATQWADKSMTTRGTAFNFSIDSSSAGLQAYANSGCVAYATVQQSYDAVPAPWATFRPNGL